MPDTNHKERKREALAGNEAFQDMVVRAAEEMFLHASIDDLITFAYGDWDAAKAAWKQRQDARFRRQRPGREVRR